MGLFRKKLPPRQVHATVEIPTDGGVWTHVVGDSFHNCPHPKYGDVPMIVAPESRWKCDTCGMVWVLKTRTSEDGVSWIEWVPAFERSLFSDYQLLRNQQAREALKERMPKEAANGE